MRRSIRDLDDEVNKKGPISSMVQLMIVGGIGFALALIFGVARQEGGTPVIVATAIIFGLSIIFLGK